MLVDLEKVPPEGEAIVRSVDPATLSFDTHEFRLAKPVSLNGHLAKTDEEAYRLHGDLVSAVELSCARCLEPFETDVLEALDLLYLPQSRNVASSARDDSSAEPGPIPDDEELAVSFYSDNKIDLAHMIWEQITLALPMKPICKPDCKGLCSGCGVNRNEATCSCAHDSTDPRWQSLRSLLEP